MAKQTDTIVSQEGAFNSRRQLLKASAALATLPLMVIAYLVTYAADRMERALRVWA